MHTLLHWATPEQKEKYLRPLCDGRARSCFAMTEPEVAGSDPTLIQTRAVLRRRRLGRQRPQVVHLGRARRAVRDPDRAHRGRPRRSRRPATAPSSSTSRREGWEIVRDVDTMSGGHNHCEIRITNLRVPKENILGGRGQGHLLGQYRLGPARLAHCMRWIGQAEIALEMMVDRSLEALRPRLAARREAGHPVDDRRQHDGALPVQADGAPRRLQDRSRRGLQERGLDGQALRGQRAEPHHRPRDPGARRARLLDGHAARAAWRPRRAGRASPTAPTRCTSGASPSARSSPTRRRAASRAPRAGSPSEQSPGRAHHFSAKGRTSTRKDQAERSWCATCQTSSAIAAGWMKKASGASGFSLRVHARSMTASITT